jgi:hypothetical protein
MLLDDVEQALLAAKWGDAEADEYEVISRMLEIPREAVVRVEFLLHAVTEARILPRTIEHVWDHGQEIEEDVRTAMRVLLRQGLLRTRVRECIRDDGHMWTHAHALLRPDQMPRICAGCPMSIECVMHHLSTPELCYKRGVPERRYESKQDGAALSVIRRHDGGSKVFPKRLKNNKVTVLCSHPQGEYIVPIEALWP